MKKIVVLGCGMVGSAIAGDLNKEYSVKIIDINEKNLKQASGKHKLETERADLSNKSELQNAIKNYDLVICAVPGFMGFETLKYIIEMKKNVVDISFFKQDPFTLDALAKENNVTAIVDCGVAPGLSNLILGYHNKRMKVTNFECLVGGLPVNRTWPFEYKAPFSPIDVLEEYIRPSRIMENGNIIIRPALSEAELVDFDSIGTLEAFNTDGLRTLLDTMDIPTMKEKTLRYPGHIEYIKVLKKCGFFDSKEIEVNGKKIKPIDLTSKLLLPLWSLEEGEDEFTVLKITIEGEENNQPKTYTYTLIDRYNHEDDVSSMSRTTGYTCTSAARLLLKDKFHRKGICPPEYLGEDEDCYWSIINDLNERGIKFNR